mmetsp:Transcript_5481/g.8274  ORF Transcript_5481/g.8274 Transcript_5481/m.8274 type:complete len:208 (+) Transcript_5481:346-969(+)
MVRFMTPPEITMRSGLATRARVAQADPRERPTRSHTGWSSGRSLRSLRSTPEYDSMAGVEHVPSTQSPCHAQEPAKESVSFSKCFQGMCPASGCSKPWTTFPLTTRPTPTPVPTVMYAQLLVPAGLLNLYSANAAGFTSVSNFTGTDPSHRAPTTSVSFQPGLGVYVMYPQVGLPSFGSNGPNVAIPKESNFLSSSHALIFASTSWG